MFIQFKQRSFKQFNYIIIGVVATISIAVSFIVLFFILNNLYPIDLENNKDVSTTVYTVDGEVLRQFANKKGIYRIETSLENVSPFYIKALLEYEDKYFYSHPGVNVFSLARALGQQIIHGRIISGGSTLTMQVARLLYPNKRSYYGKLQQIFRAIQLEYYYSKNDILKMYLTYAPMGGNIEGVEAASRRYLGKSAKYLTETEGALLAVLPQRPTIYRPDLNPEMAFNARKKVLLRLHHANLITDQNLAYYMQEPVISKNESFKILAPLLSRNLKQLKPDLTTIHSNISHNIQTDIENLLKLRIQTTNERLSAAVLVMRNSDGNVLGYKGSADFFDNNRFGHVDMVQAVRSPGSTLKPFIYAQAMDRGIIHSKSLLTDVPMRFGDYKPKNFDLRFDGAVQMDVALKLSKNIPVVLVLNELGAGEFYENLSSAGINLHVDKPNLSIALGGASTSLIDLVTLYSAIGRGGEMIFPRLQPSSPTIKSRILSKESSWIIKSILSEIQPPDRAIPAYKRTISWKTGTSYGYRDAWAIGTSDDYTVGVWNGRPDGSPYVGQTGASQAAPIMFDIFDILPKDNNISMRPPKVKAIEICWPSGLNKDYINEENCTSSYNALTINGKTPKTIKKLGGLKHLNQWPHVLQNWLSSKGYKLQTLLNKVTITHPKNGVQLFMGGKKGFKAKANIKNVSWYLNDKLLTSNDIILNQLNVGKQQLTACYKQECDTIEFKLY
jgi:penicillin-binding protein 1C